MDEQETRAAGCTWVIVAVIVVAALWVLESGNPYKYGSHSAPCSGDQTITCTYPNPAP